MMLDPGEWLVKHSSTAGLGEGRMVSVYTKLVLDPRDTLAEAANNFGQVSSDEGITK